MLPTYSTYSCVAFEGPCHFSIIVAPLAALRVDLTSSVRVVLEWGILGMK